MACPMTTFSFAEWYARMGYRRHGGQRDCAEALGITTRAIRFYLDENDYRNPSPTIVLLCQSLELGPRLPQAGQGVTVPRV